MIKHSTTQQVAMDVNSDGHTYNVYQTKVDQTLQVLIDQQIAQSNAYTGNPPSRANAKLWERAPAREKPSAAGAASHKPPSPL